MSFLKDSHRKLVGRCVNRMLTGLWSDAHVCCAPSSTERDLTLVPIISEECKIHESLLKITEAVLI